MQSSPMLLLAWQDSAAKMTFHRANEATTPEGLISSMASAVDKIAKRKNLHLSGHRSMQTHLAIAGHLFVEVSREYLCVCAHMRTSLCSQECPDSWMNVSLDMNGCILSRACMLALAFSDAPRPYPLGACGCVCFLWVWPAGSHVYLLPPLTLAPGSCAINWHCRICANTSVSGANLNGTKTYKHYLS